MDDACNTAYGIKAKLVGGDTVLPVDPKDYVFVSSGSLMTNAWLGDNAHIAESNR